MALSERERHELSMLEEQLKSEDPRLSRALSTGKARDPATAPFAFLMALGAIVLIAGVAASSVILSLAGIFLAAAGITWRISRWVKEHYETYGEERRH
ncbi:DUF3040 domain-containing protein [Arthrobacter castelli]|uniref:DUF3040 domain-containing protein n=1 Tax=Arthrobacter castelli TaxID=271431 RepID=UPI000423934D|nr:DUF3040 domain-containing protein [Arthrobacter castelli]